MRIPLSRISCTIPADLLAAADRRAAREQRSRSWVIAEALRQLLAEADMVTPVDAAVEVQSRRRDRSLEASPESRLAEAEVLGARERGAQARRPGPSVIGFDALLDHAAWQADNRRHA